MDNKFAKVKYDKPSKLYWMKEFIYSIFNLSLFKGFIRLSGYYWVNCIASRRIAKIGKGSNIHPTVILRQPERITIGQNCSINHNNIFQAGKRIATITLGNNVLTAANVMFIAYRHGYDNLNEPIMYQDCYDASIVVGDDVWIGHGATILPGVNIGRGCIIGAGAIVNKDLPDYSIAVGVPAKVIKSRIEYNA